MQNAAKRLYSPTQLLTGVLMLLCGALAADELRAPGAVTLHTVVPTECTMYFSWQSLGIFYSHNKAGQTGPITRIISCTEEQQKTYKDIDLVPSHVVPSLTVDKEHNDVYSAYNKPGAVMYWLQDVKPQEDFILVIDADMIMRQPFDPVALGAGPGWAISAFFTYMKGVSNELALRHVPQVIPRKDNLAGPPGRRGDQVGGFTLMNTKDLERVAPMWLSFTTAVRNDPTAWNTTGDSYSVNPGDKPWISEMYGYSYACSAADVWHKVDFSAMLYPAYFSATPPKVLHYGLIYTVSNTNYTFDKHWHYDFDATACPPWDMSTDHPKRGLFPHPPRASSFITKGEELLRDLLAIQVIIELNVAFCERHLVNCLPSEQLQKECAYAKELETELDAAFVDVEYQISIESCKDHDTRCKMWADAGECDANPGFMTNNCKVACKRCKVPVLRPPAKAATQNTVAASASNLTSKAVSAVQQGAAVASEAAGKVVSKGKEAVGSLVSNATSAGSLEQNQTSGSVLQQAGQVAAIVSEDIKLAVRKAADAGRGDSENDASGARKHFDDSQFKEAARQIDPEDIADVLEVQAADAEDAAEAEDEPDAKTTAGAQAASDKQNLASESKAKSAPKIIQATSADTVKQAEQQAVTPPVINAAGATKDVHEADLDLTHADSAPDVKAKSAPDIIQADPAVTAKQASNEAAGEVTHPVINAEGATKDVHESDLDLSHADSAPERHDSIEADSIVKSAKSADSDPASAAGTDNVVTAAKTGTITDPEQAFIQGDPAGGKQPGSRSQKLELGKGHMASSASAEPTATFLNRLSSGKARFTRRIITLGFFFWVLAVIGFLAILRLPRAQSFRRKPLLRRKSQTARQL